MTTGKILRWVPFTTRQDPTVEPECFASCASGAEKACDAKSETHDNPTDVDDWMREHMKETGHMHFRCTFVDFAELAVQRLPTDLVPALVERVKP